MRSTPEVTITLTGVVEARIRESTHGRIRDLKVDEVRGLVVVHGNVPTYYTRQLALQGALEVVPCDRLSVEITVG
jgi:hypothetical protein